MTRCKFSAVVVLLSLIIAICLSVIDARAGFFNLNLASEDVEENSQDSTVLEGDQFEGDILLDANDIDYSRNAIKDRSRRWPGKIVYYVIDDVYNAAQRQTIQSAIDEYHAKTCIRFVYGRGTGNYIRISNLAGCYSYVGVRGGEQPVSLQIPGCVYKGIIMHELMHAVGFWHEQSRADRDNYLQIHYDNIQTGKEHNFNKYTLSTVDHLGERYDYTSIMHYKAYSFAKDRTKPTLSPKDKTVSVNDLGSYQSKNQFSPIDLAKLNKLYEC